MKINLGRLTLVFPVLAFALCFTSMVVAFIAGVVVDALVMMTACGVNLGTALVIYWYTRKEATNG